MLLWRFDLVEKTFCFCDKAFVEENFETTLIIRGEFDISKCENEKKKGMFLML